MKKRILLIITIIIIAFIFTHSLMSGTQSAVESDSAFDIFDAITNFLHIPNVFTSLTIRKLAHFVEFAVLGIFLSATVYIFSGTFKNQIFKIPFLLLAIPVIDEFLQYFSEGRNSQVKDVLLDFGGCMFGFLITVLFVKLKTILHKPKDNELKMQ